ncbi:MAG: ThuA domain-containing protein [Planctomycetota bacterium]
MLALRRMGLVALSCLLSSVSLASAEEKLKVLLIDGQNNHAWQQTSPILKWALEDSGRFAVTVSTTPGTAPRQPQAPKADATSEQKANYEAALAKWKEEAATYEAAKTRLWTSWHPKFKNFDVVVSNYNGELWPEAVRKDFVDYVHNGGGFVAVHAANNSFPEWPEYNEMIGLGGWGGRSEKSGPYVRFRDGQIVKETKVGPGGGHGAKHEFAIDIRDAAHPIVKGLPAKWMHASDELYDKLRGPAEHLTVLATAYSDKGTGGTGENEPMLLVTQFGKGRVFHTTLGHGTDSMSGLGFQVTLLRGTEWAATGKVTIPAPKPEELTADKPAMRPMPAK